MRSGCENKAVAGPAENKRAGDSDRDDDEHERERIVARIIDRLRRRFPITGETHARPWDGNGH
jgi:hypothetical protein